MGSRAYSKGFRILENRSLQQVIAGNVHVASTFLSRLRGLMGKKRLCSSEGLLLKYCSSIHTFFMRFPIDVAFLDKDMTVIAVHPQVGPWRILFSTKEGVHTLELAAGSFALRGLEVGHRLGVKAERRD